MENHKRICFSGPTGIGKSSVNQLLASASQTKSSGSDDGIGRLVRSDLSPIFFGAGEPQFRKWELELIQGCQLTSVANAGGGLVLDFQNRIRTVRTFALSFGGPVTAVSTRLGTNASRPQALVRTSWELRLVACLVGTKCHLRFAEIKLPDALDLQARLLTKTACS